MPQVLQVNSLIQTQKSGELAAALLSVYLERAEDLPVRRLPGPSPPALCLELQAAPLFIQGSVWEGKACSLTLETRAFVRGELPNCSQVDD